jgi:outer membrane protein, multidrug efflux system
LIAATLAPTRSQISLPVARSKPFSAKTAPATQANVHLPNAKAQEAAIVENTLVAYGNEENRRASLEETVTQNRTALALSQRRYQSGIASFLEVLYTERTLLQSELSLTDSTATVSTYLVALYKAFGGGWPTETAEGRDATKTGAS